MYATLNKTEVEKLVFVLRFGMSWKVENSSSHVALCWSKLLIAYELQRCGSVHTRSCFLLEKLHILFCIHNEEYSVSKKF